jgi:hypothetical protein
MVRTVDIKDLSTDKIVARYHWRYVSEVIEKAATILPPGRYAIQSTNSGSSRPRISRKAWKSAQEFIVGGSEL